MWLSGENFIITPHTQGWSYSFTNLGVDNNDGIAKIGFSGQNKDFYFTLSGQRLLDPSDLYIYSIEKNRGIALSGTVGYNTHQYYINDKFIADGQSRDTFAVERLITYSSDSGDTFSKET